MPFLPPHIVEQQSFLARTYADGAGIVAVESFVQGWLNGYGIALQEVGAIEEGNINAELEFLRNLRGE